MIRPGQNFASIDRTTEERPRPNGRACQRRETRQHATASGIHCLVRSWETTQLAFPTPSAFAGGFGLKFQGSSPHASDSHGAAPAPVPPRLAPDPPKMFPAECQCATSAKTL